MDYEQFSGQRGPAALAAGKQVLEVIVDHTEFKGAYSGCLDLIDTMASLKMQGGVLIQAEPGMGKSVLLEMLRRRLAPTDGFEGRPGCLHLRLDSTVDTHKIACAMMLALGYPMLPSRPNLDNMNHFVAKGLARLRPKAILIDEMQHVAEGNRDITARAVTDWLKVRMDEFNVPIICAGTRIIERLNLINPQFTSRASANFVLTPFAFGDPWRKLLGAFADAVRLVDFEALSGPTARPLHHATRGNLRSLKKVLMYAAMHAAARSDRKVATPDLANAFDDAFGRAEGRANPFRLTQ